jgi:hypothetical protein
MKCPTCGAEASGKFCSSCGGSLKVEKCSSCGASMPHGGKFCTNCGKASGKAGGRGSKGRGGSVSVQGDTVPAGNSNVAWWVAGALMVVTLVALGYPVLTRGSGDGGGGMGGPAAPPGMGGGGAGGGAVDLTTMSLEEQGTLLFNRVMSSSANGDVADVEFFQPKALIIYEQINPSDPDGLYHFALIHMVGEDYEGALAKAQEGLAEEADYLLLLGVSAEASIGLGDTDGAREFYSHLLEVYDTEIGVDRVGYDHHQPMFSAYREAAQAFLNQG